MVMPLEKNNVAGRDARDPNSNIMSAEEVSGRGLGE